jgi:hypothetical protein
MSAIEPTVFGERFATNVPYSLEHPNLSALKNGYFQDGLKFNVPRFLGHRIEVDSMFELEVEQSVGIETNVPDFFIHSNLDITYLTSRGNINSLGQRSRSCNVRKA